MDKLPQVLYLQLENTASGNKNHNVFEFCTWLVEAGVFEEVPKISRSKYVDNKFSHIRLFFLGACRVHDGESHA